MLIANTELVIVFKWKAKDTLPYTVQKTTLHRICMFFKDVSSHTISWPQFKWCWAGIARQIYVLNGLPGDRGFSLLQNVQTGSGARTPSYPRGTGALLTKVKQTGREGQQTIP
jgi:hypothetical protein